MLGSHLEANEVLRFSRQLKTCGMKIGFTPICIEEVIDTQYWSEDDESFINPQ